MELALRRGYRRWPGLGQSGEVDEEGTALPTEISPPDFSSGEGWDPFTGVPAITIPELSPTELAAEQTRARAWLSTIPNALSIAGKVALTAQQISAGLAAGNLKPSSTCASGYLLSGSGQCVTNTSQGTSQGTGQLLAGVSNTTLALVGIGFLFLMTAGGGGRRR